MMKNLNPATLQIDKIMRPFGRNDHSSTPSPIHHCLHLIISVRYLFSLRQPTLGKATNNLPNKSTFLRIFIDDTLKWNALMNCIDLYGIVKSTILRV